VGIFWELPHCRKAGRGEILPLSVANEQNPVDFGPFRLSHLRSKLPGKGALSRPGRTFQDLRAIIMTKKQENTGGNPHSGPEKPDLPCLALFTPRNNKNCAKPSGDKTNTENQSWNCACI
jgi:hypothetical protein